MDVSSQSAPLASADPDRGFLSGLGWFFSGAVLPMGSLGFYRTASKRSVGVAILFFFVFTVFITVLSTISIGASMTSLVDGIHQAYQQGKVPNITISGGIAQVDGPQPNVL